LRSRPRVTDAVFQPLGWYPELHPIQQEWQVFRAEALGALPHMTFIRDHRVDGNSWKVLPLLPEAEDRSLISLEVSRRARELAPRTVAAVEGVANIQAYAISVLTAGGKIRAHHHHNRYVTATLCLQSGSESYISVAGERRDFRDGELLIFDYTLSHEVVNRGSEDRIVLLMLLDNRHVKS